MSKDLKRLKELQTQLRYHDELYYRKAAPVISDFDYDALRAERDALESKLGLSDSPLGDDRAAGFEKALHKAPMLSLDNTYNLDELRAFDKRVQRFLKKDFEKKSPPRGLQLEKLPYCVEPKIDGVAISFGYEKGQLIYALTRGNGTEGDVVTANLRALLGSCPEKLKLPHPSFCEIRGELYITQKEFERIVAEREALNAQRAQKGLKALSVFANPRNLAAGTLKQLHFKDSRELQLAFHGVGFCEPADFFQTQSDMHKTLRAWSLPRLQKTWKAKGIAAVLKAIAALDAERRSYAYSTDGAVIKLDELSLQAALGMTHKYPRYAIAYKFAPESAETLLESIEVQIGRTGVLTPVAHLTPVLLDGSTVARATLHNEDEILKKDIRAGDTVRIEKAGDIIPQVIKVLKSKRPKSSEPFNFAKLLKARGIQGKRTPPEAVWRLCSEASLANTNTNTNANANANTLLQRQVQHFASRVCMDIEHLGPAAIEQLIKKNRLKSIADIYKLQLSDLLGDPEAPEGSPAAEPLPLFANTSAQNLLEAIAASKNKELWRLLHGLGIPHVGAKIAKMLAASFGSLEALMQAAVFKPSEPTAPAQELTAPAQALKSPKQSKARGKAHGEAKQIPLANLASPQLAASPSSTASSQLNTDAAIKPAEPMLLVALAEGIDTKIAIAIRDFFKTQPQHIGSLKALGLNTKAKASERLGFAPPRLEVLLGKLGIKGVGKKAQSILAAHFENFEALSHAVREIPEATEASEPTETETSAEAPKTEPAPEPAEPAEAEKTEEAAESAEATEASQAAETEKTKATAENTKTKEAAKVPQTAETETPAEATETEEAAEATGLRALPPKTLEALHAFFKTQEDLVGQILQHQRRFHADAPSRRAAGPLANKSFVLTGQLENLTREQAASRIEKAGGQVIGSVSKKTDYVLAGRAAGSKLQKAEKLNVPIITEADLAKLIG